MHSTTYIFFKTQKLDKNLTKIVLQHTAIINKLFSVQKLSFQATGPLQEKHSTHVQQAETIPISINVQRTVSDII